MEYVIILLVGLVLWLFIFAAPLLIILIKNNRRTLKDANAESSNSLSRAEKRLEDDKALRKVQILIVYIPLSIVVTVAVLALFVARLAGLGMS